MKNQLKVKLNALVMIIPIITTMVSIIYIGTASTNNSNNKEYALQNIEITNDSEKNTQP